MPIRDFGRGVAFGVKGQSWKSASRMKLSIIDKMPGRRGFPIPGGLRLWLINTDQFKDALHYRLSIPLGEPGCFYLHSEVDQEYARNIIGEEKRIDRKGKEFWVQVGQNHLLDAEIYAMAAADPQCKGGVRVLSQPIYRTEARANAKQREKRHIKTNWLQSERLSNGKSWLYGT